jgi:4-oxalocrotonate tautomerase
MSLPFADAPAELQAILELLGRYFDALHRSDAALLADVLQPRALYATASDGELLRWSMPEYLAVVAQRESAAARGEVTREGVSSGQKASLIRGVTDLLVDVLDKDPATTFVVIDEVELEDWGIGGLAVEEFRRRR